MAKTHRPATPVATPDQETESALLFGYNLRGERFDADESVAELAALAHSAGVEVVDILVQHDVKPVARTLVSADMVERIGEAARAAGANLLIFDGELKGSQRKALEADLRIRVVDRTEVILDI
ncbi:MAG TPA: GTPase HflX, partial [bacterium]|nr:GTPase HflX [bacterium]